jgi:hypothetical protein
MLQTSHDLLNLVIAAAVAGFTFFVCWALFYLVMILRQGFRVVKETREWMDKVSNILDILKEKIEHSTSYLMLIGEGVKKLAEVIKERSEKKKIDDDDD